MAWFSRCCCLGKYTSITIMAGQAPLAAAYLGNMSLKLVRYLVVRFDHPGWISGSAACRELELWHFPEHPDFICVHT